MPQYTSKDIARFWSKVAITSTSDDCWEWQAHVNRYGYGHFGVAGQVMRSNRIAYELSYGKIPDGLQVLHKCDNRRCCNPAHLFLGTHADNMRDMSLKNRSNPPGFSGEQHPRHKLTVAQIRYIRERYSLGGISMSKLSRQVGISKSQIARILKNEHWRHVI